MWKYVLWNLPLFYFLLTKIKRQPRVKQNAAITDNPIRLSLVHWSIFSKLLYSVEASATIFEKFFLKVSCRSFQRNIYSHLPSFIRRINIIIEKRINEVRAYPLYLLRGLVDNNSKGLGEDLKN